MANTLKVEIENNDVLTHAVINGIDTNNLIARTDNTKVYAATQDCWAIISNSSTDIAVKIDGVEVTRIERRQYSVRIHVPLRKGQSLDSYVTSAPATVKIYGVKR